MPSSIIAGVGHYVPSNVVTNKDLTKLMDTTDEWIIERTGIREEGMPTELRKQQQQWALRLQRLQLKMPALKMKI